MPPDLAQFLKDAGVLGALIFFIWGGLRPRPWWVYGTHHRDVVEQHEQRFSDMERDRDYWRTAALDGIEAAKQSVSLATEPTK